MASVRLGETGRDTPNGLLLLEINKRIKRAINYLNNGNEIPEINIEILKIDKDTLGSYTQAYAPESYMCAENLKKKIEFILKSND